LTASPLSAAGFAVRGERQMIKIKAMVMCLAVGSLMLVVGSRIAPAQDVAVVNVKNIQVKLDNAKVRVLESFLAVGETEPMHSHPTYVTYVIEGGKIRNHFPDGTTKDAEVKAGDVIYREATTHFTENIGTTKVHVLLVEMKPTH
jgi:quercetin dioxygenase-like cupin family protein